MSYAQWNPSTTYIVGNIVEFAGFLYQAQSINTNVSPQPTTPVWKLIGGSGGGGIVNSITAGNTNITVGGTASNVVLSGTLTDLTGNVAGNNNYISGMYAPPFGTSAIVCAGTDTFLIEDTANVPLLAVANTGLVLGGGGTLTTVPVQAPTVVPSTDNSTNVATTAFVQSVVSAIPTSATSIDITDTNTNATFYPTFASSAGVAQTLRADTTTTPFSINPNLGNFTFGNNIRVQPSISRTAMGSSAGGGVANNTSGITAIGNNAGGVNPGANSTLLGLSAGYNNCGQRAVLLGAFAGQNISGNNAIAIGYNACGGGTINNNCIVLDANSGANITSTTGTSRLFIDPVRNATQTTALGYDTTTKEITYYTPATPATPALSAVLTAGNSAGSTAINMNSQDITAVNNLTVASPYNFSVISIYADATARDTALPTPYTGQFAFLTGTNALQFYNNLGVWTAVGGSSTPVLPSVSGFPGATYEIIYVNAGNTVIGAPVSGGFTIVRFYPTTTNSGTITLSQSVGITYLIVGGGGGGGGAITSQCNGGGGGGGGYLSSTDTMSAGVSYALQVGGGGAGGSAGSGTAGTNSQLATVSGTIIANGGGAGASNLAGGNGGSGGGGSASNLGSPFAGGTGSQGGNGGSGVLAGNAYSGGGGGAGGNGAGGGSIGDGGVAIGNTITGGASVAYAGGGGGGSNDISTNPALGGNGAGGNGGAGIPASTYTPATAGLDGRGGGGGGGGQGATANVGFKGGAGVVVVRFASFI